MTAAAAVRDYFQGVVRGWNRFWFTAVDPATLALVRICAGAMLFYTHFIWSLDLEAFFGAEGWLPRSLMQEAQDGRYMWSYFWLIESPAVLWTVHIAALVVFALLTLGLFSRTMSVLAYVMAVAYVNRVSPGAFFGLDKINCMLAMYLMLGPCGACYSLDRWLARRRAGGELPPPNPSMGANVAIRMMQLHMCIIYLFSGVGKLQGWSWWDGTAMWLSLANQEYQSLDVVWLAAQTPALTALATHMTVFWELFYIVLVWHRGWRPIVLASAVLVHGGIALAMGMITFGLIMIIGNMAFLSPPFVRAVVAPLAARISPGPAENFPSA